MLARVFALLSLALFVSAGRIEARTGQQCNGGTQHCCESDFFAKGAPYADGDGGLLGAAAVISDLLNDNCSLVSVLGSGCSQTQQSVCCQDVQGSDFSLINMQCSTFNIGL